MVAATAAVNRDTTNNPTKLQIAAMMIAARGRIARVDTTVAMALGASVAPLTIITPMFRIVTTTSSGLDMRPETKVAHSIATGTLSLCFSR